MKKVIATLSLIAFLAPAPFAVAIDGSRDALRQDAKVRQEQQEKDKAKFKVVEADASKAMQPGQTRPATPPKAAAGVEVK